MKASSAGLLAAGSSMGKAKPIQLYQMQVMYQADPEENARLARPEWGAAVSGMVSLKGKTTLGE